MGNGESTGNGGVCSTETVNGGEDVYSCKESKSSYADHLVVMVHGILGGPSDWKFGAEQFVKRLPDKVFVHCSERNNSALTRDGVDVMGERLAQEVLEIIKMKPGLRKISFVAHSVGGVVARYAIGKLFKPPNSKVSANACEEESNGTIAGLEPINFITVASPHLGSWGNKQVPFLFGVTGLESLAGNVAHWIFGRTGSQMFLRGEDGGKPPILRRMVGDNGDYPFISALQSFRRRVAYANVYYDRILDPYILYAPFPCRRGDIVGWRTSSIRRNSELPKWDDTILDERYPHIVYEEQCRACDNKRAEATTTTTTTDDGLDELEEEMVKGLSRVSWEKVDVSFHRCRFRFAAHNLIQVKDPFMHYEGADVIQHIIDHFLLG